VALPMLKLGRLGRGASMDRAAALLKQLGLADKVRRPANRLSGGEQQRVAIARALANEPAVLLADEPTGNLDRRNSELVAAIFKDLSGRGGQSIVMVTHDLALAHRARRIVRMDDGEVVDDRPNAKVLEPRAATRPELERIHAPEYIDAVMQASVDPRRGYDEWGLDPRGDTPPFAGMHEVSLLTTGGSLVAWKGRRDPVEETDADVAAEALGMARPLPQPVEPFPGAEARTLYLSLKVRSTPNGYPRRPGMARKRPFRASS